MFTYFNVSLTFGKCLIALFGIVFVVIIAKTFPQITKRDFNGDSIYSEIQRHR